MKGLLHNASATGSLDRGNGMERLWKAVSIATVKPPEKKPESEIAYTLVGISCNILVSIKFMLQPLGRIKTLLPYSPFQVQLRST